MAATDDHGIGFAHGMEKCAADLDSHESESRELLREAEKRLFLAYKEFNKVEHCIRGLGYARLAEMGCCRNSCHELQHKIRKHLESKSDEA